MKIHAVRRYSAVLLSILIMMSGFVFFPSAHAQNSSECWTFVETNKQLCGSFLDYWREHGGVSRFGFPITEQAEALPGSGRPIQYFERAVFEAPLSSLDTTPLELLPLGSDRFSRKYSAVSNDNPMPVVPYTEMPGDMINFGQAGYPLSGVFLTYWQEHGGELEFGFPISPLLSEESELDGNQYTVQYFETAEFEYHPENASPNDVILTQLGMIQYKTLFPEPQNILHGDWCGPQMRIHDNMIDFGGGVTGSFTDPVVLVFGYFDTPGLHDEPFGAYGKDYPGREQQVYYSGKVLGNTLSMTINFFEAGRSEGPYIATLGVCP